MSTISIWKNITMAKTESVPSFSILSILLILIFLIEKPNAMTLKLLHWDSPESPLYMGNLTHLERIQRLVQQSKDRVHRLISSTARASNNGSVPEGIRSSVSIQGTAVMLAEVGIGTFPGGSHSASYKSFFLHVDTASELVWTQCEGCNLPPHHCYSDIVPPFPFSLSHSYQPLQCGKHSLCYPNQCIGNFCSYHGRYGDGSYSIGILAHENFFFDSGAGGGRRSTTKQSIPLIFGCGIDNVDKAHDPKQSRLSGSLGLGWGPRSFIAQIPSQISNGKFSYCLPPITNGKTPSTFLRFGDDIKTRRGLRTTPISRNSDHDFYYLNLRGISMNGEKLQIPDGVFARRNDGGISGCVIDSGTVISRLAKPAYASLRQSMVTYFSKIKDVELTRGIAGLDLCYRRVIKTATIDYPSVTLHFQGADYVLTPSTLFAEFQKEQVFCLAMVTDDAFTSLSIIGSYQQTDQLIIYDINQKLLSFGPKDCTRNA